MNNNDRQSYHVLPQHNLDPRARFVPCQCEGTLTLDDPALTVMTDLARIEPVTITADATALEAERRMRERGVRLLFVVDVNDRIEGLITATDLLGEKPLKLLEWRGGRFDELLTRDLMTPATEVDVLTLADVTRARVGDIVHTLETLGRQHALVAETGGSEAPQRIRGIFSTSEIARRTGMDIRIPPRARTFAEIEAELSR